MALLWQADVTLVDLRESERARTAWRDPGLAARALSGSAGEPCAGGMLHELAWRPGKRIVFYCAFGERSAMAVQAAQDAGCRTACHIEGGIDAWKKAGGQTSSYSSIE